MELIEGTLLKGYKLEELIGSGGFGAVYRARQTSVAREVAVKIILPGLANQPDFIRRFESEAYIIARLEHPHITPLHDYWRDPDGAYLVMRYLRGGSVRQILENGPYELHTVVQMLDQLASALDFAHRNNVIHRDIKPGNILLDEDGNTYLADFGIAKDLANISDDKTGADAVVGSLDYISPEQARNEEVTARADIYSLGVTLYEMITGEHPFVGMSSIERLYKHINDPLPYITTLPDDVTDEVNKVIQKSTAKDPEKRYPDVLAFALAFRQAAGENAAQEANIIEQLTLREQEILNMIAQGKSNRDIADMLFVTVATVKWHITQVYKKLGIRNRVQAIVRARELNLITVGDSLDDLAGYPENGSQHGQVISLPEPENPYKGLHAFQQTDARDFFGRGDLIRKILEQMQDKHPYHRFLAIIGPSGSGKSSVVKAGLIPALWKGELPGSERWFVVDMMPGTHPLDKLETALIRIAANHASNLHDQLLRDERGLLRVADIILPDDHSELVIVVDQFEELFTLTQDENTRRHFMNLLQTAVSDVRSRVRVVITLRADYYDRPLMYPEFGELIRSRMETVLPLSAKSLERAIRGPAERVGVTFEQGLVEQIVGEMNYQSGALPLLQYALTELFDRRQGRLLTHQAYREIGGAVGALANRADEIYRSLTPTAQELTHQIFIRLVTLGEGAEDTRRRTAQSELLSLTENVDLVEEIIDQFAAYRLLSLDHDPGTRQPIVEVAHEAVLREWEHLRIWINDSRTELRLQHQLSNQVAEWKNSDEETSYLLRGARLDQFDAWSKATNITLTPLEKAYLKASMDAHAREEIEELTRQKRELALERRSQQRMRYLIGVLSLLVLSAVAFSIFALDRERQTQAALSRAAREAAVNYSLVLSSDALEVNSLGKTDTALLMALEAVNMDEPPQDAVRTLAEITRDTGTRGLLQGHTQAINALDISPDNRLLASGSCALLEDEVCHQGEIILWDLQTLKQMMRFEVQETGWVTGLAFSPDSTQLATSHGSGAVLLWSVDDSSEPLKRWSLHEGTVNALIYHPPSALIASAGMDGLIRMWNGQTGDIVQTFAGHEGAVNAVAFNPDGSELLTGGADGLTLLWDTATGELLRMFEQGETTVAVEQVAFDTNNHWIIAANTERYVWDQETTELIYVSGNTLRTQGLALADDGTAYEGLRRFIRVENPNQNGATVSTRLLYDHQAIVRVLSITGDNRLLVTGDVDGMIRVWNVNAQQARRIPTALSTGRIRLSPDQSKLVIGSFSSNTAQVYDLTNGELLYSLDDELPMAWVVEFSPDGRYIAVGFINFYVNDVDTSLTLWDAETGDFIRAFEGHQIRVSDLSFTSDSRRLLSSSQNFAQEGELILWDVETGEMVRQFDHDEAVANVMLTSDDRYALTSAYFGQYISLWDINTGELLRRHDFDTHVEFSRLGATDQTALIGLDDGRLIEVDMTTLETIRTFDGHTGTVWDIALNHSGTLMVSGQTGGTAILWDYRTGREIDRIQHPGGFETNVAFGTDDKTVFTSAYTGDVIEWNISDQSLSELRSWTMANRYVRDLTCEERELYSIQPVCES